MTSHSCSSSGMGSVCSAARWMRFSRDAMGDVGVDGGTDCPPREESEMKCTKNRRQARIRMIQTAYSSGSGFNSLARHCPFSLDNWFPPSDLKG